jgi:hypothetical protein
MTEQPNRPTGMPEPYMGRYSKRTYIQAQQTKAIAARRRIEKDDRIREARGTTLAEHEAYVAEVERRIEEQRSR